MSDSLRDDLQNINGIGEKKTEKIVSVIADHGGVFDEQNTDNQLAKNMLVEAKAYHDQGDHAFVGEYLEKALDAL